MFWPSSRSTCPDRILSPRRGIESLIRSSGCRQKVHAAAISCSPTRQSSPPYSEARRAWSSFGGTWRSCVKAIRPNQAPPDYIRGCVARWLERAASSGHNLLGVDLDRLAASQERAAELQRFLAALRQWVDKHSLGIYPDGRAATWLD